MIEIREKLASPGRRFVAGMIDVIPELILGITIGVIIGIESAYTVMYTLDYGYYGSYHSPFTGVKIVVALLLIAYLAVEVFFMSKATTVGGAIMGIKVVDDTTGNPISFPKMLLREFIVKNASDVLFLGYIWILIDDEYRSWHDKILDTLVIDSRLSSAEHAKKEVDFVKPDTPKRQEVNSNWNFGDGGNSGTIEARGYNSNQSETASEWKYAGPRPAREWTYAEPYVAPAEQSETAYVDEATVAVIQAEEPVAAVDEGTAGIEGVAIPDTDIVITPEEVAELEASEVMSEEISTFGEITVPGAYEAEEALDNIPDEISTFGEISLPEDSEAEQDYPFGDLTAPVMPDITEIERTAEPAIEELTMSIDEAVDGATDGAVEEVTEDDAMADNINNAIDNEDIVREIELESEADTLDLAEEILDTQEDNEKLINETRDLIDELNIHAMIDAHN